MPTTSIAERMARQCYGKSADPAAPENISSLEFQTGHKAGTEAAARRDGWRECDREHIRRGLPAFDTPEHDALEEWRRGFWAGFFTRLGNEMVKKGAGQ